MQVIPRPAKRELQILYWDKHLSHRKVAEYYAISPSTVIRWFKQYNMQLREQQNSYQLKGIEKICLVCGRKFTTSLSQNHIYCSRKCHYQAETKPKEVYICAYCSKKFEVPAGSRRISGTKFCSTHCQYLAARKGYYKICSVCGRKFYASPSSKKRTHCSRRCVQLDFDLQEKRLRKVHIGANRHPTKPESELLSLLQINNLPYKYVGDGQLIIKGCNPDFVNVDGKKKLIELFGFYWHAEKEGGIGKTEKIQFYKSLGFDCLIVWDYELDNPSKLLEKITAWDSEGVSYVK